MMSYTGYFYNKVYFKIVKIGDEKSKTTDYIVSCQACPYFRKSELEEKSKGSHVCPQCRSKLEVYGPVYSGNLHNVNFIQELESIFYKLKYKTADNKMPSETKLDYLLTIFKEESKIMEIEKSYAIDLSDLNNFMGINFPRIDVIQNVIANNGFKSSKSHMGYSTLITNSPVDLFYDLLRVMHKIKVSRDPMTATKFKAKANKE